MNRIIAVVNSRDELIIFTENGDIYRATRTLGDDAYNMPFTFHRIQEWRPVSR